MIQKHSLLFQFACQFIKYFTLFIFGLGTVCLISAVLGATPFANLVLSAMADWWWRLIISALLILGIAVIFESLK
ncbi:MAG TPA: hypothetical protein ACFE0H_14115 [Elainellaceae cyanobacterium]